MQRLRWSTQEVASLRSIRWLTNTPYHSEGDRTLSIPWGHRWYHWWTWSYTDPLHGLGRRLPPLSSCPTEWKTGLRLHTISRIWWKVYNWISWTRANSFNSSVSSSFYVFVFLGGCIPRWCSSGTDSSSCSSSCCLTEWTPCPESRRWSSDWSAQSCIYSRDYVHKNIPDSLCAECIINGNHTAVDFPNSELRDTQFVAILLIVANSANLGSGCDACGAYRRAVGVLGLRIVDIIQQIQFYETIRIILDHRFHFRVSRSFTGEGRCSRTRTTQSPEPYCLQ